MAESIKNLGEPGRALDPNLWRLLFNLTAEHPSNSPEENEDIGVIQCFGCLEPVSDRRGRVSAGWEAVGLQRFAVHAAKLN